VQFRRWFDVRLVFSRRVWIKNNSTNRRNWKQSGPINDHTYRRDNSGTYLSTKYAANSNSSAWNSENYLSAIDSHSESRLRIEILLLSLRKKFECRQLFNLHDQLSPSDETKLSTVFQHLEMLARDGFERRSKPTEPAIFFRIRKLRLARIHNGSWRYFLWYWL